MGTIQLKKTLIQKKSEKLRRDVANMIRKTPKGVNGIFVNFKHKPTEEEFLQMVVSAKYGPGNPLQVNSDFTLEYVLDEYKRYVRLAEVEPPGQKSGEAVDRRPGDPEFWSRDMVPVIGGQSEFWGNLYFQFAFDARLLPFLPASFSVEDFRFDESINCWVDKDSGQIGLFYGLLSMVPIAEAKRQLRLPPDAAMNFASSPIKSNDHCTICTVVLSTTERFTYQKELSDAQGRSLHGVRGHERHLSTGKVVAVREHHRANPTGVQARKLNLDEVGHVVYVAYDHTGVVRYVGEGKDGRPSHVNSGISHNFKLNQHFFLNGPMRVEVLQTGLSKQECLAIEKLLIRRHAGTELWNIKDNIIEQ